MEKREKIVWTVFLSFSAPLRMMSKVVFWDSSALCQKRLHDAYSYSVFFRSARAFHFLSKSGHPTGRRRKATATASFSFGSGWFFFFFAVAILSWTGLAVLQFRVYEIFSPAVSHLSPTASCLVWWCMLPIFCVILYGCYQADYGGCVQWCTNWMFLSSLFSKKSTITKFWCLMK